MAYIVMAYIIYGLHLQIFELDSVQLAGSLGMHLCMDRRTDTRANMCADVRIDVYADTCAKTCVHMRIGTMDTHVQTHVCTCV